MKDTVIKTMQMRSKLDPENLDVFPSWKSLDGLFGEVGWLQGQSKEERGGQCL